MDDSSNLRLGEQGDITVQDKGQAAANIFFDVGTPFENEPVIPTLSRIAEEVTRTIEAFDILIGRGLL
jgi:hypothetical protein